MYTQMKFTEGQKHFSISELFDNNTISIEANNRNNASIIEFSFSEKEMRELRKHLTIQIRKIKPQT